MNVSVDTNVLARAIIQDDPVQCETARALLRQAARIVVSLPCLCELVWVLRAIKVSRADIAYSIRTLLDTDTVVMNRPAVQIGLAIHDAGGDFADGIMAYEGRALASATFVSFDRKAVKLLSGHGFAARLLP